MIRKGHVWCMGKIRITTKFWPGRQMARNHLKNLDADGGDIKINRTEIWFGFIWRRRGRMAHCREHGNEASDSIKDGEFTD